MNISNCDSLFQEKTLKETRSFVADFETNQRLKKKVYNQFKQSEKEKLRQTENKLLNQYVILLRNSLSVQYFPEKTVDGIAHPAEWKPDFDKKLVEKMRERCISLYQKYYNTIFVEFDKVLAEKDDVKTYLLKKMYLLIYDEIRNVKNPCDMKNIEQITESDEDEYHNIHIHTQKGNDLLNRIIQKAWDTSKDRRRLMMLFHERHEARKDKLISRAIYK